MKQQVPHTRFFTENLEGRCSGNQRVQWPHTLEQADQLVRNCVGPTGYKHTFPHSGPTTWYSRLGAEEGETCNRDWCQGTMEILPDMEMDQGCCCFIAPPCSWCVSHQIKCGQCFRSDQREQ